MPTELNQTLCRRLIVAHLITTLPRPSVPVLMATTGWPRRTLQDILKGLPSWGIQIAFTEDGVRHNDGYYQILDWGPFQPAWIAAQLPQLCEAVELQL